MSNQASVSIGTSAASIISPSPGQTLFLQNTGASLVTVGTDATVVVGSGIGLSAASGQNAGGTLQIEYGPESTPDLWYGIATGTGQSIHYLLANPRD